MKRRTAVRKKGPANDAEVFRIAAAVAHREVDGLVLVLAPRDQELSAFNESGAMVWRGISRGRSIEQIARDLAARYGLSRTEARADACALIADLRRRRLVTKAAQGHRLAR